MSKTKSRAVGKVKAEIIKSFSDRRWEKVIEFLNDLSEESGVQEESYKDWQDFLGEFEEEVRSRAQ